jgi:Do/DeqQ family serine protease
MIRIENTRNPISLFLLWTLTCLPGTAQEGQPARPRLQPQTLPDIADLAEALSPAVVYIESTSKGGSARAPQNPFEFFMQPERGPRTGLGSGVLVDGAGYILTNNHVIEGADSIRVTLNDGREFKAKIVGFDPQVDVAVLQIEGKNLTYAALGDSEAVRVGDWVLAIGNPLGYRYTVTLGIVSALGRSAIMPNTIENYIQTDAAINQGNSGGPLINMRGEVVGINTAISANGQNIGFAIPINMVASAYRQIRSTGRVARGAIGIQLQALSSELKEYYGVSQGALVQGVNAGSPGAAAGLKEGDVILSVDGQLVRDNGHMVSMVATRSPGEEIEMDVLRNKKQRKIRLTLGDRAKLVGDQRQAPVPDDEEKPATILDLSAYGIKAALSNAGRKLEGSSQGLAITEVTENSPAWEKGIRPGQRLLQVNDVVVNEENIARIEKEIQPGQGVIRLHIGTENGTVLFGVRPIEN